MKENEALKLLKGMAEHSLDMAQSTCSNCAKPIKKCDPPIEVGIHTAEYAHVYENGRLEYWCDGHSSMAARPRIATMSARGVLEIIERIKEDDE